MQGLLAFVSPCILTNRILPDSGHIARDIEKIHRESKIQRFVRRPGRAFDLGKPRNLYPWGKT